MCNYQDPVIGQSQSLVSLGYLEDTHGVDYGRLDQWGADKVIAGQEVVSHSHQGVLRPALEPVHGAARNEGGELERTTAELLSHLLGRKYINIKLKNFLFKLIHTFCLSNHTRQQNLPLDK